MVACFASRQPPLQRAGAVCAPQLCSCRGGGHWQKQVAWQGPAAHTGGLLGLDSNEDFLFAPTCACRGQPPLQCSCKRIQPSHKPGSARGHLPVTALCFSQGIDTGDLLAAQLVLQTSTAAIYRSSSDL